MTDQEIEKLPTILHILDSIAMKEEQLRNNPTWGAILSDEGAEDMFEIFPESSSDLCVLKPTSSLFNSYFRGQSIYHEPCVPTLFRSKDKRDDIDRFIEQIRTCEFELLIDTHPFVNYVFKEGLRLSLKNGESAIKLKVDALALAQHYELQTDLIDFTSSKWVAAFFAVCKQKGDAYVPAEEEGYGVIYAYWPPLEFEKNYNRETVNDFSVIGLQPFARPGEQKASTLRLGINEDLNTYPGVDKYFFRHDKLAAEIICNRLNQGDDLFPDDKLTVYADKIKDAKKLSVAAFNLARKRYPIEGLDDDELQQVCFEHNIKLVNYPIVKFPREIDREFKKEWKRKGEEGFLSKIVYRAVYPISLDQQ